MGKYYSQGMILSVGDGNETDIGTTWGTGTWWFMSFRFAGGSSADLESFYNDTNIAVDETANWVPTGAAMDYDLCVGGMNNTGSGTPANGIRGKQDEFRLSQAYRSENWLDAEYGNQNAPSSWYTVQTVEYN
jgi:hypothetical protein